MLTLWMIIPQYSQDQGVQNKFAFKLKFSVEMQKTWLPMWVQKN